MAADAFEMSEEGMLLPKMFISKEEKTFQYDEGLQSLPIPNLEETLQKYLRSTLPHLTKEEFEETSKIVKDFGSGVGMDLNRKLKDAAKYKRNWLEEWWEKYAYLSYRSPHAPLVNFAGPGPYTNVWAPKEGTQVERASIGMWCSLKYWQNLRKEQLAVDKGGMKGVKKNWSMSQFRRMFNSCKTPGEYVDKLNYYFKTEREGQVDDRVMVLHKGRIFVMHGTDGQGNLLTPLEIQVQLKHIVDTCKEMPWGPAVGALTYHNRTDWYRAREHMIKLNPVNAENLEIIQKSVFALSLDDQSPQTTSQLCHTGLCGDARNRWADKSILYSFSPNGLCGCNCDHAPHDAMIMVSSTLWNYLILTMNEGKWKGTTEVRSFAPPKELEFVLDSKLHMAIEEAKEVGRKGAESLEALVGKYPGYGRKGIRKLKHHPDTYIQIAMQYAYYRLYNRPAPTYETASTRQFYNARTETLRSCSVESTAFCRAMLDEKVSKEEKARLLTAAFDRHNNEMVECQNAMGCDRHLFGLQCVAMETGMAMPEIFTHPSWKKSGGDGSYVLSTSFVGYTPVYGGVAPMCKDGYGCFYSIEPEHLNFFISTWTADIATNAKMMLDSLFKSLDDMYNLLTTVQDQAKL